MNNVMKHALQIFNGDDPIRYLGARQFSVPSETTGGVYYDVDLEHPSCTHPEWIKQKKVCKHIQAARLMEAKLKKLNQIESIPNPYANSPIYDAVAEIEEEGVYELLRCLGAQHKYVLADFYKKKGRKNRHRPPAAVGDLLVLAGIQCYRNKVSRKAFFKPEDYLQRKTMAKSTLRKKLPSEALANAALHAFRQTVDCVRQTETDFAMDSWYVKSPNSEIKRKGKDYVYSSRTAKGNWVVGLRTHVCVAFVMAEHEDVNDQLLFEPALEQFEARFRIDLMLADRGYDAERNFELVAKKGGKAYILCRETKQPVEGSPHYNEMLALQREDYWNGFHPIYRYRYLVESAIHSLKSIKKVVRGRRPETIANEMLVMVLVYNLRMLLMAHYMHDVALPFADERAMAVIDKVKQRKCYKEMIRKRGLPEAA